VNATTKSEQAQKIAIASKVGVWSQPWNIDADISKKAAACNLVVFKAIWLHGQGDTTKWLPGASHNFKQTR
jgi:hypothetical protein